MTKRLVVCGRVQGVGYRAWTVHEARSRGLSGWVRNRSDGSVEILASGDDQAVAELAHRCRKGPGFARVDSVDVSEADGTATGGFEERPTL